MKNWLTALGKILIVILITVLLFATGFGLDYLIKVSDEAKTVREEYNLEELADSVYASMYTAFSSDLKHSVDFVTVYREGKVITYNGNVEIFYEEECPRIYVEDYPEGYKDNVKLYIPKGTLQVTAPLVVG